MNNSAKKRLVSMGIIIIMVMVAAVAILGGPKSSQALSVSEAASGSFEGKRVQVSGAVVDDSLKTVGSGANFVVTGEPGTHDSATLEVLYQGALPATFGNGIVAISSGNIEDGKLHANQLVTKCPSKYESAQGALTVANILDNKDEMLEVDTKLAGYIVDTSMRPAGSSEPRMKIESQGKEIDVYFDGALSDEFSDGVAVVLSGKLGKDGAFYASDAAIDAEV